MNILIHKILVFAPLACILTFLSCQKKESIQAQDPDPVDTVKAVVCPDCKFPDTVWKVSSAAPQLVFRIQSDSTQIRLNNLGQISTVAPGNGAQSPQVNDFIVNYLELMPESTTEPGKGVLLYRSEETTCGGLKASNFCKTVMVKNNQTIFSAALSSLPKGSYKWLRISLLYMDLSVHVQSISTGKSKANVAGFYGNRTYLTQLKLNNTVLTPTMAGIGNKNQGYWIYLSKVFGLDQKFDGQLSEITVVNPNPSMQNNSGSSWIYGEFYSQASSGLKALEITGNENQNLEVVISLSTNKCFEWKELTVDGLYQPEIGETIVDFGCRGIIPRY